MMEQLNQPLYFAIAGFVVGMMTALFIGRKRRQSIQERLDKATGQINSLTAKSNLIAKSLDAEREKFETLQASVDAREQRIHELETAFETRTEQFEQTRTDLKEAVIKTRELRKDLVEHAEDALRAEVHARDVEHELDLLQNSGADLDSELLKPSKD